jgi:hypothetical protein
MTTLSARHSSFVKRVLPFLAVAGAGVWSYWSSASRGSADSIWGAAVVGLVATVIMVVVLRRGLWAMADTVELSEDTLRIQRWTTTASIPLSDIKSVNWEPYIVGSLVTVELRQPNSLGTSVRFYAPDSRKVPSIISDLESFAARVKSMGGGEHVA